METQTQQPPMPNIGLPPHHFGSNIVALTNPRMGLQELELDFRGQKLMADGTVTQVGEVKMNEVGIASVMGQVRSIVDQITILGNLDENHMEGLWLNFNDTLIKDLMQNRKKYEIITWTDRDIILTEASNKVWSCLLRAYKEGDRRFWKGQVLEHHTFSGDSNKSGLMSRMMPWKKE